MPGLQPGTFNFSSPMKEGLHGKLERNDIEIQAGFGSARSCVVLWTAR
jgi:hypothetical protein